MKKTILLSFLITFILGWSACTDDNSSMGHGLIDEITVEGIEGSINVASYQGVNLKDLIKPTVTTSVPEEQLTYAWYLYDNDNDEGSYKDHLITSGKNIDYEVNLPSGTYTLIFEITDTQTGYAKIVEMTILTTTSFSKGFYILKETPDGNTDLDMVGDNEMLKNLISGISGSSLQGKPYNLSFLYSGAYIDPESNDMTYGNLLYAISDKGQIKGYRTEDMFEIFNNDNLFYGGTMPATEQPGTLALGMIGNFYFSNTGVRFYQSPIYGSNTGKFGYPVGAGASKFIQLSLATYGFIYWSNEVHGLMLVDGNGIGATPVEPAENVPTFPDDLICIASSMSVTAGSIGWFLCEQPSTGDRYLLKINLANSQNINDVIKIDPASHLARSTVQSGNGYTASYIYCIDNGKAYAYSLVDGTEHDIPLPGIPANETVSYISNQWLYLGSSIGTEYNFDNLIVGTQNGDTYKLYFYQENELNGGMPIKAATKTATGTGKVKTIRYVTPLVVSSMDLASELNPFPLSD